MLHALLWQQVAAEPTLLAAPWEPLKPRQPRKMQNAPQLRLAQPNADAPTLQPYSQLLLETLRRQQVPMLPVKQPAL